MDYVEKIKEMDEDEVKQRVVAVLELVKSSRSPTWTVESWMCLDKLEKTLIGESDDEAETPIQVEVTPTSNQGPPDKVIISCDASIKKNPGGPASVGYVIQYRGRGKDPNPNMEEGIPCMSKTTTINQAEYEAIYAALSNFFGLVNNPLVPVEVRSDSKLVIDQINGKINCNDPELKRRKDIIVELVHELPVPVSFQWRPRNSTPELELANYLAQDVLGVPRH